MWLIDFLFRAKNFTPTPIPDNWPPDGSMHFIDVTHASRDLMQARGLPETFRLYEFSSNRSEQDFDAIPLAHEIIQRLCENRPVLMEIASASEDAKQKKRTEDCRFPARYRHFLEKAHPNLSLFAESEKRLAILTTGFYADALLTYAGNTAADRCFFEFFLFPEDAAPVTAEQARRLVQKNEYDLCLWLNDSPLGLDAALNTAAVSADSVQAVAEYICDIHGVLFSNPPPND